MLHRRVSSDAGAPVHVRYGFSAESPMAFEPIILGALTLGASPRSNVDHICVALTPTPDPVWLSRFSNVRFSPPQLSVSLGSVGRPVVNGATVEFDVYIPQAATLIGELKAAVAETNAWYTDVHEPALAAKAASAAEELAQRVVREAELNALLAG